jgi:hypothetical protein
MNPWSTLKSWLADLRRARERRRAEDQWRCLCKHRARERRRAEDQWRCLCKHRLSRHAKLAPRRCLECGCHRFDGRLEEIR